MSKPDDNSPPPEVRRLSLRLARCRYVLAASIAVALLVPWLYSQVLAARERARNAPRVWQLGQGSANHLTVWITGSGEPASEVNRLVGEAVNNFVEDIPPREIKFVQWAKSRGLPHSRAVQLCISVPHLSGGALGRLHEIPRTDGIYLGVRIEASQISDDGVHGLTALRNLNSIMIRGCQISNLTAAGLRDALPDCTVDVEEVVVDL